MVIESARGAGTLFRDGDAKALGVLERIPESGVGVRNYPLFFAESIPGKASVHHSERQAVCHCQQGLELTLTSLGNLSPKSQVRRKRMRL